MGKALDRKAILEAEDRPKEFVAVPEWGEDVGVYVRALCGKERDIYEGSMVKVQGSGKHAKVTTDHVNMRAKLVAATVVDEEGNLLFKQSDIERLGEKSGKALDRIFAVAQRLSGMNEEAVEDAAKNLLTDQGEGSTSV